VLEPGAGTADGQGKDGEGLDGEEGGGKEGEEKDGEEDKPDPNAGKTAEERGAAKNRKKGKATDDSKPKPKGGAGGANAAEGAEDADDAAAAAEQEEEEVVPGGQADIGEETRVNLQNATLDDDMDEEDRRIREQAGTGELTPEDIEAARTAAADALVEWREQSAAGAGSGARAQELWRKLEHLTGMALIIPAPSIRSGGAHMMTLNLSFINPLLLDYILLCGASTLHQSGFFCPCPAAEDYIH
jgi:hypothetical protein